MGLDTTRCVVLNATYEPITIVSSKRALILFLEGKAMIVEEHPELVVRSPSQTFPVPTSIVLKHFVKGRMVFRTKALLTQRNLFIRDQYTCQYCGRNKQQLKSSEFLTRDHVMPRHIGGRDIWENVVTCCNSCNNKKAYHLLEDINMTLLKIPTAPTIFELWTRQQKRFQQH
jgi:5-methylcytosine-specific restriction endonuclease McrA